MWQCLPACVGVYRITTQVIASKRWLSSLKIVNSQRQKKLAERALERAAPANTAERELTCARERKVGSLRERKSVGRESRAQRQSALEHCRSWLLMLLLLLLCCCASLLISAAAGRAGCAAWLMKIIVTRQIFKCVVGFAFAFALLLFFACA